MLVATPQQGSSTFDGTTGKYIDCGDVTSVDITGNYLTAFIWYKVASFGAANLLFGKQGTTTASKQYGAFTNGSQIVFEIGDGAATHTVGTTTTPIVGRWTNVCFVKEGTTGNALSAYHNGRLEAVAASALTIQNTAETLRIGSRSGDDFPFNGQLAHFALWDAALTSNEVFLLGQGANPLSIRPTSLRAYYPLGHYRGLDSIGRAPGTVNGSLIPASTEPIVVIAIGDVPTPKRPGSITRGNIVPGSKAINEYNTLILKDQPAAYWPMDDLSGPGASKLDLSPNKKHLSVSINSLLTLVDNSDHVASRTPFSSLASGAWQEITPAVLSGTANITLECWIKLIGNPNNNTYIIYNGNGGANGYGLLIHANRTLELLRGGVAFDGPSTSVVPLNRWTHVALTRGASQWLYWINGVQDATNPGTGNPGSPSGNTSVSTTIGQTSCAAVYAYELTGNQLLSHYYAGLTKRDTFDSYVGGESLLAAGAYYGT